MMPNTKLAFLCKVDDRSVKCADAQGNMVVNMGHIPGKTVHLKFTRVVENGNVKLGGKLKSKKHIKQLTAQQIIDML